MLIKIFIMRLAGKTLLMIVTDGVDQLEFLQLKRSFEDEGASVLVTTPQEYISVQAVDEGAPGIDVLIDLPFEAVEQMPFDGLVIPDGLLSSEGLRKDSRVVKVVADFHQQKLPIFASGNAVQVLYDSKVLTDHVVVREGTPLHSFVDKAVGVLLDHRPQAYRSTISV